jgi:hypothetical protein
VRVSFCDGAIITSLIHDFPVYAKPHASSNNRIMMMCAGHFARFGGEGGKASLGKAKKVNNKGQPPTSQLANVSLHRLSGKWCVDIAVEEAYKKSLYLGLFGGSPGSAACLGSCAERHWGGGGG